MNRSIDVVAINDSTKLEICLTQFASKYPKATLLEAIDNFQWGRDAKNVSLKKRLQISQSYKNWVKSGADMENALHMAGTVYRWGFNGKDAPPSLAANLFLFRDLNLHWFEGSNHNLMEKTLAEFLSLHKIGIASASKWICFCDETRFAIYDSRVSAALRPIKVEGKVVFPTVGRRAVKGRSYPTAHPRSADQMARDYLFFINFVNMVASEYKIGSPARVEMGLFMLGDIEENWI